MKNKEIGKEKKQEMAAYGTGYAAQFVWLVYGRGYGKKMAMTAMLRRWAMGPLLLAALMAGCASGPSASGPSGGGPASNPGGEVQTKGAVVTVGGNVTRPVIPWQDGLTLMQAFTLSGYQGAEQPAQLVVHRKGQLGVFVDYQKLYDGQDMLLEPGDKIDILLTRVQ
jgi:hypothetical protein